MCRTFRQGTDIFIHTCRIHSECFKKHVTLSIRRLWEFALLVFRFVEKATFGTKGNTFICSQLLVYLKRDYDLFNWRTLDRAPEHKTCTRSRSQFWTWTKTINFFNIYFTTAIRKLFTETLGWDYALIRAFYRGNGTSYQSLIWVKSNDNSVHSKTSDATTKKLNMYFDAHVCTDCLCQFSAIEKKLIVF